MRDLQESTLRHISVTYTPRSNRSVLRKCFVLGIVVATGEQVVSGHPCSHWTVSGHHFTFQISLGNDIVILLDMLLENINKLTS